MDAAEKFVARDRNNLVTGLIERQSGGPMSSDTGAQPTWVNNVINGYPALSFFSANGATNGQNLRFTLGSGAVSTMTGRPIAIFAVAAITASSARYGNTIVDIGSLTNPNPGCLVWTGTNDGKLVSARYVNDDTNDLTAEVAIDTNFHVYTFLYDGQNIILRIDGVQKKAKLCV